MGSGGADGASESSGPGIATRTRKRNRFVEWVLVDGNRLSLALAGSVLVFALLLVLYDLGVIAFTNDDSVTRMASGMIAGSFSLVTLVVSVNQLILSQEFSPASQFRDRLGGLLEFERDVEDAASVPASPTAPARLLELLAAAIRDGADDLARAVSDHDDEAFRTRATRYAEGVADSTERIDETLDRAEVKTFDALSAAVRYDDAWQLHAARHLRNDAAGLSEEADRAFDDLTEALRLFSTAQAHLKTIYLQRELTRFSQLTIYSGIPAVAAAVLIALLYGDIGAATVSASYLPYVTSLLATVVFVPLLLLASYILRTATLTRRTATVGVMLPRKEPEEGPFEVSYGDAE